MNYLLFIYIFAIFVLFSPSILFKKINIIHAFCFSIILYFTYDIIYKNQEYMTPQLKVDVNGLHDLVNSLNEEVYEKIINVDVTNEYTIDPAKDNSVVVEECREKIDEIVEYKKKIEHLSEELSFYEGTRDLIVSLENTVKNLEKKQDELEKQLELANDTIDIQLDTIDGKTNQIKSIGEQITGYDGDISGNQVTIRGKNADINNLNTKLAQRNFTLDEKIKKINELLEQIKLKETTIKGQTDDITEKDNTITSRNRDIKSLNDTINKKKNRMKKLNDEYKINFGIIKKNNEYTNKLKDLIKKCNNDISDYEDEGCYRDTGNRALRYGPHGYGYTAEQCRQQCDGFEYFALQNGNGKTGWCSCDNDWNHVTKYGAKSCGKTGNGWGNYVYKNNKKNSLYVDKGCYKDTGNRALRYGPHRYGYTAEKCREACPSYKYFALQNGNGRTGWCSCDNDWNHVTKYGVKSCGKTGDGWGNYVYQNKDVT